MLIENTLFGLRNKVKIAIDRLKQFEPIEGYYLAFSGGKDSIVLYALAELAGIKFKAYYNNTTVDPPELVKFIRENYPQVIENKPKKSMFQLIRKKGLPYRTRRWCCQLLKEINSTGVVLTGIRWQESIKRKSRRMVEQCKNMPGKSFVHPIIDWKYEDIWEFIKLNKLAYCKLYDLGRKRIGCILCPMASKRQKQKDVESYPQFVKAYKLAGKIYFERLIDIDKSILKKYENYDQYFEFWLYDKGKRINLNQLHIYD